MNRVEEAQDGIRKLLQQYEYGRFNLIGQQVKGRINKQQPSLEIDDFFHHDIDEKYGDCSELTNSAWNRLRRAFPRVWFYRAEGTEPLYFHHFRSTHHFILATEEDEVCIPVAENPDVLYELRYSRFFVIDPSFGLFEPLLATKYNIRRILHPTTMSGFSTKLFVDFTHGSPLGKAGDRLVHYWMDLERPGQWFAVQEYKGKPIECGADSSLLAATIAGDERLEGIVASLAAASITSTTNILKKERNVYI